MSYVYTPGRGMLGTGSGGGLFFGTQITNTIDANPQLGFYGVAPIIAGYSQLGAAVEVDMQFSSYAENFDVEAYQGKIRSLNKAFYITNVIPSNPDAMRGTGSGWSTVVVFRPGGTFEVFALVWTASGSYSFIGALTAFEVDPSTGKVAVAGPTLLRMAIQYTAPLPTPGMQCYTEAVQAIPAAFVSSAQLFPGKMPPAQTSRILQSWILGLLF